MKRTLFFLLNILIANIATKACTNFIVGKNASADGSVIVSYNADSWGMYGVMYRATADMGGKGKMRKIYEWDTNKYLGEIPQAEHIYNVVGQMNDQQVIVTETTFGGREELVDTAGLIDYGSLIYLALERAATAREAIKVMTSLVEKYGYCSEGETFSIADKNEAWILEMVGKGPGNRGAVWVAVRIPDNCICAHANQSRITRFNMKDKENVMYSKDVVSFARKKGLFKGKDSEFSFRDAYCPPDFSGLRFCEARVWSFFNRWTKGMDKYLDFAMGNTTEGEMPLYIVPDKKLSVRDVMTSMRDHYEGTPMQLDDGIGAGGYGMPYRPTPLTFKYEDKSYFNERPTSTQQTGFSFVGQARSWLPNPIGGIVWWGNDDANMIAYTPVYCGVKEIPQCFTAIRGEQDDLTFSWNSAFWLCNVVSNMVYPYYSKIMPDLAQKRDKLENDFAEATTSFEKATVGHFSTDANNDKALQEITDFSIQQANKMMAEWKDLFAYIVVKHNDMCVKKEKDGKFEQTENGIGAFPVRYGYPEQFKKRIVETEGERYSMK